jgi:predicted  nucleic acid-binding Zn-ribbon protein
MPVTLPTVDPNVMTAVAAAGGAILIKVVERWLGRRNENNNEAERIRKELREELTRYRSENIRLEKELDEWRTKYWEKKKLYDSDELRINELESEVSGGAAQIRHLTDVVEHLMDDVKKIQEE